MPQRSRSPRVAIVHYWLVGMRGGERVLEELCRIYPEADIVTHVVDRKAISPFLAARRISTTFIDRLPFARRLYKAYLPLMPIALEQVDLRGYDLIISSESGPAKGIIPPAGALHVCYCHSPMRYIWNMYQEYRKSAGRITRFVMPVLAHYLRSWDSNTATRVDSFVANSFCVADRLQSYYGRRSTVIYPPVATDLFQPVESKDVGDYYLMVGELVGYKRVDLAVEAFNRMGKRLVIIGGGEMLSTLRGRAASNVTLLGPQPLERLRWHYARCRALIFPGEEDFGIVPVEAMASGRPVIAFRRGGATETVVDGLTGLFFDEQTDEAIITAVRQFETMSWDTARIAAWAQTFEAQRFRTEFKSFVDDRLDARRRAATDTVRPFDASGRVPSGRRPAPQSWRPSYPRDGAAINRRPSGLPDRLEIEERLP